MITGRAILGTFASPECATIRLCHGRRTRSRPRPGSPPGRGGTRPGAHSAGVRVGTDRASEGQAQVIFCRGLTDSLDGGCVDLVALDVSPVWRITDVRYYGFPGERMHLAVPSGLCLDEQLAQLVRTIAGEFR